ncbi:MAG: hypothetical protein CMD92_00505 [Gammaproteobacteria bacterium]|nr:hypothetical protein [Gammaproteobacteria bacterium]
MYPCDQLNTSFFIKIRKDRMRYVYIMFTTIDNVLITDTKIKVAEMIQRPKTISYKRLFLMEN